MTGDPRRLARLRLLPLHLPPLRLLPLLILLLRRRRGPHVLAVHLLTSPLALPRHYPHLHVPRRRSWTLSLHVGAVPPLSLPPVHLPSLAG